MVAPVRGKAYSGETFCGQWEYVEPGVISTALSLQSCFSLFLLIRTAYRMQHFVAYNITKVCEQKYVNISWKLT